MSTSTGNTVAVARGTPCYAAAPPYSPGVRWPEYGGIGARPGDRPNPVYETVRHSLRLLGLDTSRFGSAAWNPLGEWISPGQTVLLKPNFVRDFRDTSGDDGDCLITHGAVIRAVLDYAYLALQGRGRLIVADAPQNDADFDAIRRITHIDAVADFYRREVGFPIEVYDLRPAAATKIDGVIVGHRSLPGDPAGYVKVDLGPHSAFAELGALCGRLYGAEYDRGELVKHHSGGAHEYLIARTVLDADCVISMPKLKTHKKVGLTANMKNLVGINGNKNWLPHHREGTAGQGGDQFDRDGLRQRTEQMTLALFKRYFPMLGPWRGSLAGPIKAVGRRVFGDTNAGTVRSGNWHGNDTTWRMVIDLNRILAYADAAGVIHEQPRRRVVSVVDAIIAGEANGPLDATPRHTGLVVTGADLVAVDLTCARLMGFDHRKIPMLQRALAPHVLPIAGVSLDRLQVHSNDAALEGRLTDFTGPMLGFTPHFGWQGHIEVGEVAHEARRIA